MANQITKARSTPPPTAGILAMVAFAGAMGLALWEQDAGADGKVSVMAVAASVSNNCTITTGAISDQAGFSATPTMNFRAGRAQLSVACTQGAAGSVRLSRTVVGATAANQIADGNYYFYTRHDKSELWGDTGTYRIHQHEDGETGMDAFVHTGRAAPNREGGDREIVLATLEF